MVRRGAMTDENVGGVRVLADTRASIFPGDKTSRVAARRAPPTFAEPKFGYPRNGQALVKPCRWRTSDPAEVPGRTIENRWLAFQRFHRRVFANWRNRNGWD